MVFCSIHECTLVIHARKHIYTSARRKFQTREGFSDPPRVSLPRFARAAPLAGLMPRLRA